MAHTRDFFPDNERPGLQGFMAPALDPFSSLRAASSSSNAAAEPMGSMAMDPFNLPREHSSARSGAGHPMPAISPLQATVRQLDFSQADEPSPLPRSERPTRSAMGDLTWKDHETLLQVPGLGADFESVNPRLTAQLLHKRDKAMHTPGSLTRNLKHYDRQIARGTQSFYEDDELDETPRDQDEVQVDDDVRADNLDIPGLGFSAWPDDTRAMRTIAPRDLELIYKSMGTLGMAGMEPVFEHGPSSSSVLGPSSSSMHGPSSSSFARPGTHTDQPYAGMESRRSPGPPMSFQDASGFNIEATRGLSVPASKGVPPIPQQAAREAAPGLRPGLELDEDEEEDDPSDMEDEDEDEDEEEEDDDSESLRHYDKDIISEDEEEEEDDDAYWRPPLAMLRQRHEDDSETLSETDDGNSLGVRSEEGAGVPMHEIIFPRQAWLWGDARGIPRGACSESGCASLNLQDGRQMPLPVRWWPVEPDEGKGAHFPGDAEVVCSTCGYPLESHAKLTDWMEKVTSRVDHYRAPANSNMPKRISGSMIMAEKLRKTVRSLRKSMNLPAVVPTWDPNEAAFFIMTEGHYDPRLDSRGPSQASSCSLDTARSHPETVFVSVICPTTCSRHPFHEMLYMSFARQTHERRELIVIDTGKRPSPFFTEQAGAKDPRVIYKFYPDEEIPDQPRATSFSKWRDGVRPGDRRLTRRLGHLDDKFRRRGPGKKRTRASCWSLGLKRNLACHLARGAVIMHFDDDDLYAPTYISGMLKSLLLRGCRAGPQLEGEHTGTLRKEPSLGPALATLKEWHLLDLADQSFGFLSPEMDPLVPEDAKESMVYGYGFTYAYTRAAWELCPFPDVDWCEDGDFVEQLRQRDVPIALVRSNPKTCPHTGGLAVHTYHPATTSGGEFAGFLRLGDPVPAPNNFVDYLPLLKELAVVLKARTSECHWLRRELKDQEILRCPPTVLNMPAQLRRKEKGKEVGLREKERLLSGAVQIPRKLREELMFAGPCPNGSKTLGGIHLRTAPSSRARYPMLKRPVTMVEQLRRNGITQIPPEPASTRTRPAAVSPFITPSALYT